MDINLFEYKQKKKFSRDHFCDLDNFLDKIWRNRERSDYRYGNTQDNKKEYQQFIRFLYRTNQIQAKKYVGVIHYKGEKINLLPKIFFDENEQEYSTAQIQQIQKHIFWWLSYCEKLNFPNYNTSLGHQKADFFEILIYLFSKYTKKILEGILYQQYEEINTELTFIKGRLDAQKYIDQNLSRGKWHKLNCSYESFVFDNKFNRILKYVSKILFNFTNTKKNKENLQQILFILDEVTDERPTVEECKSIKFNPVFSEFETVRSYCELFLSNCISFNHNNNLTLFAFLIPMEVIFEDFIANFIKTEISGIDKIVKQKSDTHLDVEETFKIKPDLYIEYSSNDEKKDRTSVIIDTKYKIIYSEEKDPKKGVSQNDLYQILAYAVRLDVQEVFLFYPDTIQNEQVKHTQFQIKDELANKKIVIKGFQVPIINRKLLRQNLNSNQKIQDEFLETKERLKKRIEEALQSVYG